MRSLVVARGLAGFAKGAYLGMKPPGLKPEIFAPGIVTLPDRYEYGFSVSPDGREIFFGVATDGRGDIRTTRYVDGEWTTPQIVVSHPDHSFADPFRSRDGTRLYFISTRSSAAGGDSDQYDLWCIKRRRDGWSSEPINLGGPVNSAFNEYYVTFADDGTLAFASNKHEEGRADIYVRFKLKDGTWSSAISLGRGVNTAAKEFTPSVSRDGRFLFYSSNEDVY